MVIFGTGIFGGLGVELDSVGLLELGHFSSGPASDWTLSRRRNGRSRFITSPRRRLTTS